MRIIEPGHVYVLDTLDDLDPGMYMLVFVKRMGNKYPGNTTTHAGTTVQEVMRCVVDRLAYVCNQEYSTHTVYARELGIKMIHQLELRAALRANRMRDDLTPEVALDGPTCPKYGHVQCQGECHA